MKQPIKIVSGGQTGADRAALDFAIQHNIPHGGWCPKGRIAEDGTIPDCYQLTEARSKNPVRRTELNVLDSDATVIFTMRPTLTSGSKKTATLAKIHGKPCLHLSHDVFNVEAAAERLCAFTDANKVKRLNVAGPRESKEPKVGGFVDAVLLAASTGAKDRANLRL